MIQIKREKKKDLKKGWFGKNKIEINKTSEKHNLKCDKGFCVSKNIFKIINKLIFYLDFIFKIEHNKKI